MAKKRTYALFIAVVATLVLTLAATIFFFNARPVSKRATEVPNGVPAVTDPAFATLMEAYLGTPVQEGNRVTFLQNGEEIFPAMLEAIAGATDSITLESYEFWGERVAGAITDALIERAEAGVAVHVLLDFIGSMRADPDKFEHMEEAGIELIRWRRPSWYESGRFNNRTHRKLLVIDGRLGFCGGANMGDDWWGGPPEETYRDNHYLFEGPVVAQLQAAFLDNWLIASNRMLLGEAYFPPLEPLGGQRMQVVISSPMEGKKRVRSLLLLAFGAARERILIQTAFFYPDFIMKEALLAARERGVEVIILAPGDKVSARWVRYASRNRWGELLEGGVRIHEFEPSMFHSKLFIVDDAWTSVGSVNFDNRSFRLNDETNVNIFCRDFAAKMTDVFEADLATSTAYDLERWQARGRVERLRGLWGNVIGPHL